MMASIFYCFYNENKEAKQTASYETGIIAYTQEKNRRKGYEYLC
ncbi:hypothetical protein RU95_GL002191 [Enterococcus avium]|nr:hypothetical protein RU95_GL002191 [Enterococcus avium]